MTVYEIPTTPPEPPIGSIVVDKRSEQWVRGTIEWACVDSQRLGRSWYSLLTQYGPLTLIQTQTRFPTAPIVEAEGLLWFRNGEGYFTLDGREHNYRKSPFTGVVTPVTVVPTAEWEALVDEVDYRTRGYHEVDVEEKAKQLIDAADELEINQ